MRSKLRVAFWHMVARICRSVADALYRVAGRVYGGVGATVVTHLTITPVWDGSTTGDFFTGHFAVGSGLVEKKEAAEK